MIIDLQLRLNSVEEKIKPGPSDVDHLDKSMGGVSQCMKVDEQYKNDVLDNFHADVLDHKSVEGVGQCTGLNEEYESVVVDGLISFWSQDVGHLSKVRELINDVFHTPSVQDACVSELLDVVKDVVNINSVVKEEIVKYDVNVNSLVKEDIEKDDIHVDSFVKEILGKMMCNLIDGNELDFSMVSRATLKEAGYLLLEPNADWAMASLYLCDMLSRFQYPLYYANGVKYGVPWFANNVQKVYFPINKKDSHWVLEELHISSGFITIYDSLGHNAEVFEKKNIVKDDYSISFQFADGVPIQGGLYGRYEKKRLDHLKQDQEMLVIKIFSKRKKVFRERKKCEKIRAKSLVKVMVVVVNLVVEVMKACVLCEEGDEVINWTSSGVIGERVRVMSIDVFFELDVVEELLEEEILQMIIDLQLHLNSVEKKLKPGPLDVGHLDKISNLSKNAPDCGLNQQSMGGVNLCMNVDEPYKNWNDVSDNFYVDGLDHKSVEGVSQCTCLNDEYKSVAVDVQDACVSELLDVVKDDDIEKDDVHVDSFVKKDIEKDDVQCDNVVKDAKQIENET
uniref:Ulp1 protease family, C-terminal catalytic domain-containing protein n=1 Tax=Tanacetum cinerariifolium TaxID=118510 RepID=A0A6L2NC49_TANCI|nr:ulp1 protease family, C-terminal catalytic domain-containing protein [Tanacetum cinerariifolium]